MTEYEKALHDARAEFAALTQEMTSLGDEERRLESRLKEIRARKAEIVPTGFRATGGLLDMAARSINVAQRKLADSRKPQLAIRRKYTNGQIAIVVSRVTPKRIYLREAGSEHEQIVVKADPFVPYGWDITVEQIEALAKATEASCK